MDVTTIQMHPAQAEAKLEAYRAQLARKHSQDLTEWRAAEAAYAELAKGTVLIDPIAAIRDAGWRDDARPKLAIARADQRFVKYSFQRTSRWWNSSKQRFIGDWSPMDWTFTAMRTRQLDRQRSSNLQFYVEQIAVQPPRDPHEGMAMVPMIPPDVYPARGARSGKAFHPVGG